MILKSYFRNPDRKTRRQLVWFFIPLAIFAAMAIMFAFALLGNVDPSRLPSALMGKQAPRYDFPPLEGLMKDGMPVPGFVQTDLADGKATVVNFFASWCGPCIQEHPLLKNLKQHTNVRMVGINYKDRPPGGLRFLKRLGNPFDHVGVDASGRGAIEWGVYGMPETFIVNGKGRIIYKHVGPIDEATLRDKIIPAVKQAEG